MQKGGVGFFDSGVGGLTVMQSCLPFCRGVPLYYYGDNANVPYGEKGREELRGLIYAAFDSFAVLEVAAAVIACNTVTALFVEELRARYSFPIVGIEPALLPAARLGGCIYALSTPATHASARYNMLLRTTKERYPRVRLEAFACKGLADAIERLQERAVNLEEFLPRGKPNAVVLGCTHYSYLKKEIAEAYGAVVYDGNEGVAKRLSSFVKNREDRPLFEKNAFFKPPVTTFLFNKTAEAKKWRKSGRKIGKKCVRFYKIKSSLRLYFLGSGRFFNRKFYEQMFVFNKMGK